MGWLVGLDLGQAQDPTALAAVEQSRVESDGGRSVNFYAVRYLQRWPLGTPYTRVVADVADLLGREKLAGCPVAVDMTGVGRAVVDLLREQRTRSRLFPATITAGQHVSGDYASGFGVPKKELVSALQVPLQSRRLVIASGLREADVLRKELGNFRVKVTAAANETFGVWREGQHDDLVLALALAVWLGEKLHPPGSGQDPRAGLPAPHQRTLVPMPDWCRR
jgi:hypothetical protein